MSSSLVKQSLDLFDYQLEGNDTYSSRNIGKKSRRTDKNGMNLISSNKQGVWKELRKLQSKYAKQSIKKKQLKKKKSTLEEYKDKQDVDYTNQNIKVFKQISSAGRVKSSYCKTILDQHRIKLAKDIPKPVAATEKESIFTDRDFEKFEEEYDFFKKLQ